MRPASYGWGTTIERSGVNRAYNLGHSVGVLGRISGGDLLAKTTPDSFTPDMIETAELLRRTVYVVA